MIRLRLLGTTVVCLMLGCRATHDPFRLLDVVPELPADGREHLLAEFQTGDAKDLQVDGALAASSRFEAGAGNTAKLYLRTQVRPATLKITIRNNRSSLHLVANLTPDDASTADGLPDWMRLHSAGDRRAFRQWFTTIAEQTADTFPDQLPPEITDCASFIRYAYREALRLRDARWYAGFPTGLMPSLPSVQQWTYPNTPLGPNLFRTRPGPFHPADLADGTFTQFADAKTLHYDNAYLLGRDLRFARPGDMIFYRVLETNSQYHSMIITGEHGEWVVYNTGPDHGHHGEMRRVLLADLLHHPDPQWRPEAANPNWLGVYRWNILRED